MKLYCRRLLFPDARIELRQPRPCGIARDSAEYLPGLRTLPTNQKHDVANSTPFHWFRQAAYAFKLFRTTLSGSYASPVFSRSAHQFLPAKTIPLNDPVADAAAPRPPAPHPQWCSSRLSGSTFWQIWPPSNCSWSVPTCTCLSVDDGSPKRRPRSPAQADSASLFRFAGRQGSSSPSALGVGDLKGQVRFHLQ